MAKLGIDISTHQGKINLAALKDKIDFTQTLQILSATGISISL